MNGHGIEKPIIGETITTQKAIDIICCYFPDLYDLADKLERGMRCITCSGRGYYIWNGHEIRCGKCNCTGIIDPYLSWVYDGVSLFPEQSKKVIGEKALLALRKAWNWMLEKIWPGIGHKAALPHDFSYMYAWGCKEHADAQFKYDLIHETKMKRWIADKFYDVVNKLSGKRKSYSWGAALKKGKI